MLKYTSMDQEHFYFYQMLAQYILLILHHMLYKLYHLYHGQYCILYTF